MKYRIASVLLASVLIGTVSGCSGSSSSESESSVPQTTQAENTDNITWNTTADSTEGTTAENEKKLYDNGEIYSNIYLLGHQLSSPLTVGDLGDDFDFTDTWGSEFSFEDWFCVADYKGKNLNVCSFVLENCSGPEDIKDSTKIKEIYVDSDDKADYDEPVISVYGITIGDTRDDVCQKIGAPSRTLETSLSLTDDYRGDYGETLVSFEYSEPDFTQIEQITVYLR